MKKFARILAMLLALVMVMSVCAACGGDNTETTKGDDTPVVIEPVTFPLEEPYTIKMMFKGDKDWEDFQDSTWYQKLCEETNVFIEPINLGSEPMTTLNAMLNADTYGDVIFGGVLNDTTLTELAYGGFLLPIEDYITNEEIMPNYVNRGLANLPQALAVATLPDGHVYSVARIDTLEAAQLESPLHMNGAWLEQAGMDQPTTIEEFEEALIYFRDHDMNGNGDPSDEIPLLVTTSSGNPYSTIQALLGFWGMPTKDSALDSYCYIEDGVVKIVPYTETYKEAIKTISRWYQEGLIWSECFTANTESFNSRVGSELDIWGATLVMEYSSTKPWSEDIVTMLYPEVEGYTARAYINCGVNGYKNTFTLTNNCEHPEIVLAWLDKLYSQEAQVNYYYGLVDDEELGMPNRYDIDEDGNYVYYELTEEESKEWNEKNTAIGSYFAGFLYLRTDEDYACNAVKVSGGMQQRINSYELYKEIINEEIWPRPYYTMEVSDQIGLVRTDVYAIIQQYESMWITGQRDIDEDWDSYIAALEAAGVQELERLLQESYDLYLQTMEK